MTSWIAGLSWIAQLTILLALISVIGIALGKISFKGLSLGIGGVLFGGILVSHFVSNYNLGFNINSEQFECARHYIQEFGLILFVYAIGNSVGPSFFASLRSSGVKLVLIAVSMVVLGFIVTLVIYESTDIKLASMLGIYAGAVTNTPALAAGTQMLTDVINNDPKAVADFIVPAEVVTSYSDDTVALSKMLLGKISGVGEGYAVAYPFGILGLFITIILMRFFFKVSIPKAGKDFEDAQKSKNKSVSAINIQIKNSNLVGHKLNEIPDLKSGDVVCSRLKRNNVLIIPQTDTVVELGDIVHLVGDKTVLDSAILNIGNVVDVSMSTKGTDMISERLVVTNNKIFGKTLASIAITKTHDCVISRMIRAGVEIVPNGSTRLQFGDIVNVVGLKDDVEEVSKIIGDSSVKLQQVHPLPLFLGIGLGILLGSIAIPVPGIPAALKLGLAGGPLIMAILLSAFGGSLTRGKLSWLMPPSANAAIKEIGIVLFLACVGLNAGKTFVTSVSSTEGLWWLLYGAGITFIPAFVVSLFAMLFMKVNYLSLCGTIAGAHTDPPALAYSNSLHTDSVATSLAYATVYPFTMFLRILSPQIFVIVALFIG